jgi:integrase
MRAKLTQPFVSSTQPGPADISIIDTTLAGFELRIRSTGTKMWAYRYRAADGRQHRLALGRFPGVSAAAARQLALAVAGDVARGIDVLTRKQTERAEGERARQSTLKVFLETRYEPWAITQLRTGAFQVARIKADFKNWLDKPMSDLNTWLVEGWRKRQLEAGNKPVTVNRNLQRLQALLSKAVQWKFIERHPFVGLKPLKYDRSGRVRYLNADEEQRLRAALGKREADLRKARERFNQWRQARGRPLLPFRTEQYVDHLQPIVLLALNSGLRRGEIFNLRWKDIDLASKWLTVVGATAKSGQTRRIPLNTEVCATLEGWQAQAGRVARDTHVFPGVGGNRLTTVTTAWRSVSKLAKLDNFRFHDLRHHFASRLVQSGIDLNVVRELMGHADITMVLRYGHLSPDRLTTAVEKVAR